MLDKNKNIAIFGGGDSALDWALELSKIAKITLIHRREEFRGAPHTLSELKKLKKEGKVSIKTPFQIKSINEGNKLKSITFTSLAAIKILVLDVLDEEGLTSTGLFIM